MQDNNYNGNYNNNYNGNYNNNSNGNYNNDIGSYNNTGNNNDFDNGFNNQENNPNQLSSKKALKGYLVIFIITGVLLSIYFLSDSKDSKKEEVKESNSNIVSETANQEKESNIVSNRNTTPVSNIVNEKTSNKAPVKTVPVKSVSISGAKTVVVGSKITLKATINPNNASNKKLTWKSSNTGVATVSNSGVVTGVKAGSTTISVTTADGNKKATYKVTVTSKTVQISKISIDSFFQDMELEKGRSFDIKEVLKVTPSNAGYKGLKYSSSNPKVATISSNGTVKTINNGKVTLTVTAPNGSKATLKLTVVDVAPTVIYVYGEGDEITMNDLSVKIVNFKDNDCSINQTCKQPITLVANIGKKGNINKYTLKTGGSKVNIIGTNYKAAADIVDGRVVINIYGLSLN